MHRSALRKASLLIFYTFFALGSLGFASSSASYGQNTAAKKLPATAIIRENIKKGNFEKALFLINDGEKSNKNGFDFYFLKGRVLQELKRNTDALASYSLAIFLRPNIAKAYVNRALVKGALGDPQGAVKDLDRALEIEPDNAAAYLNRGVTYASLNKPELAIKDFNRAIRIDARYSDAYRNRGIVRFLSRDLIGSCADWRRSIELGSSDVQEWTRALCTATPAANQ